LSLLQNSNAISTGGAYNLESSLRFRSSASAYLSRVSTSADSTTKYTLSFWMKRGSLGSTQGLASFYSASVTYANFYINSNDQLYLYSVVGSVVRVNSSFAPLLRDPSSWYHIVLSVDTTQATASDRVNVYINNEKYAISSQPTQNNVVPLFYWTNPDDIKIGAYQNATSTPSNYFDGYLTEYNYVDGQALTADDFGEYDDTTGVWKPKEYTGTYGTNGFYLPMKETQQATGFNTVLWTGTGAGQSITGVGFSPDLVWAKSRTNAYSSRLYDSVRGATKELYSAQTTAETTTANSLLSFDADGFTVGNVNSLSQSGSDIVAWCWDAGSSTVSNTDGTTTSTVRANPASGFSIVTYNASTNPSTVGHGLGTAPKMIIIKNRSFASGTEWIIQHDSIGWDKGFFGFNTSAPTTSSAYSNNTAPTSDVFTVSSYSSGSYDYVAYCFSEVAGFSKFGSYTGTGSSGNSVTGLGFRPAFLMVKNASSTGDWYLLDNTRSPDNTTAEYLRANLSNAEAISSTGIVDFDSDGFTVDTTGAGTNASGNTYIYMAFADTRDAQFNFDASGNKNNWTANNINSNASSETTYDIMNDVPTLTDEDTANFATLNSTAPSYRASGTSTISNANLTSTDNASSYGLASVGTMPMTSGKWYWEVDATSIGGSYGYIGIAKADTLSLGSSNIEGYIYSNLGYKASGAAAFAGIPSTAYGASWTTGDVIGVALDMDAGTLVFYKNGVSQGTAYTGITGEYVSGLGDGQTATAYTFNINFGQRPFKYTPPTGYKKLNTYNLPDSTIKDGSQYMNTVLYTGDDSADRAITGVGFSPDFVWLKTRNIARSHWLIDSVRGTSVALSSDTTSSDTNLVGEFDSFDSDGFTISHVSGQGRLNYTGRTYVGWNWRGSDSSPVSNTDGTITSTVSANTDSGFSVVTYTGNSTAGSTVGHGLNAKPDMILLKSRSDADNWRGYHSALGATKDIILNTYNGASTNSSRWNNTEPTSSVFTIGIDDGVNENGDNFVAYCFAEVEGFSKFGKYISNASTDGPFVYTGFRPAFVLIKRTTYTGDNWVIYDSSRNTYNVTEQELYPNTSSAEVTGQDIDFVSNGFKIRSSNGLINGGTSDYIYMAFAENPFKHSLAR